MHLAPALHMYVHGGGASDKAVKRSGGQVVDANSTQVQDSIIIVAPPCAGHQGGATHAAHGGAKGVLMQCGPIATAWAACAQGVPIQVAEWA